MHPHWRQHSLPVLCTAVFTVVPFFVCKAGNYQRLHFPKVAGCPRWHEGQGTAIDHSLPNGGMALLSSSVTVLYLSHQPELTQKHKYVHTHPHLHSNLSLSVIKLSLCSLPVTLSDLKVIWLLTGWQGGAVVEVRGWRDAFWRWTNTFSNICTVYIRFIQIFNEDLYVCTRFLTWYLLSDMKPYFQWNSTAPHWAKLSLQFDIHILFYFSCESKDSHLLSLFKAQNILF